MDSNELVMILNVSLTSSGMLTLMIGILFGRSFVRVGESPDRVLYAVMSLGQGQFTLGGVIAHSPVAYLSGTAFAVALYLWWRSGGGGGIRRALKKIKSSLSARAVPQAVGA